jgi:3-isopropylmalate/(R)-2-methylmalate dehydratase small subunit
MTAAFQAITTLSGTACALPLPHVDTDQIMPKQFLKGIDRQGLAQGFLHDMRFDALGQARRDFVLNQAPWNEAKFLITGANFGCGSSREHAVWGLRELGIRCVLGTSFGGIFSDNCMRNGVPALVLPAFEVDRLMALAQDPQRCQMALDLAAQTLHLRNRPCQRCAQFVRGIAGKTAFGLKGLGQTGEKVVGGLGNGQQFTGQAR